MRLVARQKRELRGAQQILSALNDVALARRLPARPPALSFEILYRP